MRTTGTTTEATTYDDDASRAEAIRAEFAHSWKGYRAHAFGHDELEPVSATHRDNWGGVAMTLVDSLDTLWLMGGEKRGGGAEREKSTPLHTPFHACAFTSQVDFCFFCLKRCSKNCRMVLSV